MADIPIIFSAPMVRALLREAEAPGTGKTQTRRVLKPWAGQQAKWLSMETLHRAPTCYLCEVDGRLGAQMQHPLAGTDQSYGHVDAMSPLTWVRLRYAPGDRLWVREAWRSASCYDDISPSAMGGDEPIRYEADEAWQTWGWGVPLRNVGRLRPSIHMPRWASRLTLTVTDVRVERLQDITEADAVAEGIERLKSGRGFYDPTVTKAAVRFGEWVSTAKEGYSLLWNHLHGPGAWCANDWVAALTFTVEQRNIDAVRHG